MPAGETTSALLREIPQEDLGGFGVRLVAYIIDVLILTIPTYLMQLALQVYLNPESMKYKIVGQAFGAFISFIYFGPLQAELQGSIGKKTLGLTLVSIDGEKLTLMHVLVRYFIASFGAIAFGMGYLSILWNPYKQGWHDRAAGTVVLTTQALKNWKSKTQIVTVEEGVNTETNTLKPAS